MINYGFSKELEGNFDDVKKKVVDALKVEGFGILTEIDVRAKFKEKQDNDFKRNEILGACNPANAHKSILAEENIGLMLPCNVALFEKEGKIVLSVIKPSSAMKMIENEKLNEIAFFIE
ncbi:MAG: DUF302 domain-containing protein [Spirochaetales bacterium]|jgi:uncharacterized protein (DUF302 family)|nr:DUF302 domain-containing protein [Spirochaetales bacterium]